MIIHGYKKTNRLIQKILSFFYILKKIHILRVISNYDSKSINILWIKISSVGSITHYIKNNDLLDDLILLDYLSEKKNYRIVFSSKIGSVWNSNIYYSITKTENYFKIYNYSEWLTEILNFLQKQNNNIFPDQGIVRLWENKIEMHNIFRIKDIPTPQTYIDKHPLSSKYSYLNDFIVKTPHSSGSKGLYHFNDYYEYVNSDLLKSIPFGSKIIVQERLNMTFDLRVVINRFKVQSYYWRRNKKDEKWRPTATSLGSTIDYEPISNGLIKLVEKTAKDLNLPFCAFDLAFQNDDLSVPLFLEVSSSYQLNPVNSTSLPYREFKQKLFIKNPYWKEYVNITQNELITIIKYYENQ